jgi:aerobic-type carbon monoxide dehydrogenase small subunit (CoxS/CutS family)
VYRHMSTCLSQISDLRSQKRFAVHSLRLHTVQQATVAHSVLLCSVSTTTQHCSAVGALMLGMCALVLGHHGILCIV